MSTHHDLPEERSNPLLWMLGLSVFVGAVFFFLYQRYEQGRLHGLQTPLAARPSGPVAAVPDHAAMIGNFDQDLFKTGKKVYEKTCAICHGVDGNLGLNAARKYTQEDFKYGADPYSIWITVVQGNGAMAAQLRDPVEAYATVHYLREAFLKPADRNYVPVTAEYLAGGAWPAPGAATSDGQAPSGATLKRRPIEAPVRGVLVALAESQAKGAEAQTQLRQRLLSAAAELDGAAGRQLAAIARHPANDSQIRVLASTLEAEDRAAFQAAVSAPGSSHSGLALSLLSDEQFATLQRAVAGGLQ